nr:hypothetical protein [Burkholderia glumae]
MTKTHLLPLPSALVRQQQLRHHVAWSLFLDQRAEPAQLAMLLNVAEATYLLALATAPEQLAHQPFGAAASRAAVTSTLSTALC